MGTLARAYLFLMLAIYNAYQWKDVHIYSYCSMVVIPCFRFLDPNGEWEFGSIYLISSSLKCQIDYERGKHIGWFMFSFITIKRWLVLFMHTFILHFNVDIAYANFLLTFLSSYFILLLVIQFQNSLELAYFISIKHTSYLLMYIVLKQYQNTLGSLAFFTCISKGASAPQWRPLLDIVENPL